MNNNLLCIAIFLEDNSNIENCLESIINHVNHLVVLVQNESIKTSYITNFCTKHNIPLKLEYTISTNITDNRNTLLKLCYKLSQFVLLLNSECEVKYPEILINELNKCKHIESDLVFECRYETNNITHYDFGVIRNNIPSIKYEFPVYPSINNKSSNNILINSDFYILQKSNITIKEENLKEHILTLKKYVLNGGNKLKSYKYICSCYMKLKDNINAYIYSERIIDILTSTNMIDDFSADYYNNLINKGTSLSLLGNNTDYIEVFTEANNYYKLLFDNAEPFFYLATACFHHKNYKLAYNYIKKSCNIAQPTNYINKDIKINNLIYTYRRWVVLLQVSTILQKQEDIILANKELQNYKEQTNKETLDEQIKRSQSSILYLVVTYRDREKQLVTFIPHMQKYLTQLSIKFKIIIVEQDDNYLFNKGLLYNTAVKYIRDQEKSDNFYVCLHDIDIIPVKQTNYYKPKINSVTHLYGYEFCIGGIALLNYVDYLKINGFSNMYEGWGFEDNDFQRRVISNKVIIDRSIFYKRYDSTCFEETNRENCHVKMALPQSKKNKATFIKNNDKTGLNILDIAKYITVENKENYTHIKCKIEELSKTKII